PTEWVEWEPRGGAAARSAPRDNPAGPGPGRPSARAQPPRLLSRRIEIVAKPLRSNFEPGSVREAARRAQWKALGLTDEDLEKPKIAVVNSSSELPMCFRPLARVAAIGKAAIWAAGGLPFWDPAAAPAS